MISVPEMSQVLRTLSVERRTDGVAIVRMDVPGAAMNTLRADFGAEFSSVFNDLERDVSVQAVVFLSRKADNFIAGADIKMLRDVSTAARAESLSREGQRALQRIVDFRAPVVAAIHGACLGGGLEVALACHARVATSHDKTRLGLPEVRLGLLPALGGTQRLPRLIGVQAALDLLLTGKQIDAARAKRLGLVDEVVPEVILLAAAIRVALARALPVQRSTRSVLRSLFDTDKLSEAALAKNPLGRKLLFDQAKKRLFAETHGNYPAPERILEVVKLGLGKGIEAGLGAEAHAFGELVVSPEAQALISVFFATTELKKDPGHDAVGVEPRAVNKVGVLGAGLMGAGIAFVTASEAKIPVRIKDRDEAALGKGLRSVREILDRRVKARRLSPIERDRLLAGVTTSIDYAGFSDADVVIEAVFEDLTTKQNVLMDLESVLSKHAIFASNTSALPIARIGEKARRPEHVIGMHYFSPVDKMPLLEVVVTPKTSAQVTATCVELGKKQGKTVIVVRDGAGFYTSRILGPYLNEASFLLAEGASVESIDRSLVKWGFPVGPLHLLDEIGIDVAAKVGHVLYEAFGERMAPHPSVERLVLDQRLGKKNRRGFYVYEDQKLKKRPVDGTVYALLGVEPHGDPAAADIAQRCALQMVNEACHCYGEGILRSARDGDVGAIFGLGFPPFRGGPFRYVDSIGAQEIVRRLESYAQASGARFTPAPVLSAMALDGTSFYGERLLPPGSYPFGRALGTTWNGSGRSA
jgi:3-hydroxyacyl-CoA dehydrogenase / enoyl-CoA hydratase / 3-hydroxybutyryl-CoA epimerase